MVDLLEIPPLLHKSLEATVTDFIVDNKWNIPDILLSKFPVLRNELLKVVILCFSAHDQLIWRNTKSGSLCFKDAFLFLQPSQPQNKWFKFIWNPAVPPSKSFVVWRLLHNRIPSDEQLIRRGCHLVSVCNLHSAVVETTDHIFLYCAFAKSLWNWLSSAFNRQVDVSSIRTILSVCYESWSPQMKDIITAAIINILWIIWYARNKARFEGKQISIRNAISIITASVALSGNLSKNHVFLH